MSLADFMRELQSQEEDVVYSVPPEDTIKMIPPEKAKNTQPIKVIPPQKEESRISTITFKIKKQPQEEATSTVSDKVVIPRKREQQVEEQPKKVEEPITENKLSEEEQLFIRSETPEDKKSLWLEYYTKAKNSRKENYISDKMRRGRFSINRDNKVEILPELDIYEKTSLDILHEQWL